MLGIGAAESSHQQETADTGFNDLRQNTVQRWQSCFAHGVHRRTNDGRPAQEKRPGAGHRRKNILLAVCMHAVDVARVVTYDEKACHSPRAASVDEVNAPPLRRGNCSALVSPFALLANRWTITPPRKA